MQIQFEEIIPEHLSGLRLDQALRQLLPMHSRTRIKQWVESGYIQVNGLVKRPRDMVSTGEQIVVNTPAPTVSESWWQAEALPLDVVYADDDVLVINKSAHCVVHPGAGNWQGTLVNALLHFDANLQHIPRVGIVHRLDKDTTGLLVVARSLAAHTALVKQLQARTLSRVYQALVRGKLVAGSTIEAPIGRHAKLRKRMCVTEQGKPATTHYRILQKFRDYTLLEVHLETGRTHQIRVHMNHIFHPIVGDKIYGKRAFLPKGCPAELSTLLRDFPRQALHAWRLSFDHPQTGQTMTFEAPLPPDLTALIAALGSGNMPGHKG